MRASVKEIVCGPGSWAAALRHDERRSAHGARPLQELAAVHAAVAVLVVEIEDLLVDFRLGDRQSLPLRFGLRMLAVIA